MRIENQVQITYDLQRVGISTEPFSLPALPRRYATATTWTDLSMNLLPARSAGRWRGNPRRRGHGPRIGAAHDPSVAVRRRHLPALRAGRKSNSPMCPRCSRMTGRMRKGLSFSASCGEGREVESPSRIVCMLQIMIREWKQRSRRHVPRQTREESRAAGSVTVKTEPLPGVLWMSSRPRWRLTTCLTMARPSPVPPSWRERALSTR